MGSCASAFRKSEIFKYKNSENVKHGSCVLLLSIASMLVSLFYLKFFDRIIIRIICFLMFLIYL